MRINVTTEELNIRKERVMKAHRFEETDRRPLICYVDIYQYLRMIGVECEDYMSDPKLHLEIQLNFQKFLLDEFETDQYSINPGVDLFVVRLANAFGSDIKYIKGSLPWAYEWVEDEKDLLALEKIDVTNNGLFLREKEYRKYALDNAKKYPVELADGNVVYPLESMKMPRFDCDGIFSIAQLIMGMEKLMIACFERPDFVHKLLDIITNKYIEHWHNLVETFDVKEVQEIVLADDTASFLNPDMFEEFSVPYMKRIRDTFPNARAMQHYCKVVPQHVEIMVRKVGIDGFTGFKPNKGINSIRESFKPVNDLFANKILLYPDTDPCIVETASSDEVYKEVMDILETFEGTKGVVISFSTWSPEKSQAGMKACRDFANKIK